MESSVEPLDSSSSKTILGTSEEELEAHSKKYALPTGGTSIHPYGRDPKRQARKRQNRKANLEARAATNSARAHSLSNPTWHGIGMHSGVNEWSH